MRKLFLLILALIVLAFGFSFLKGKHKRVLVPVNVVEVKRGSVRKVIDATGIMKPQVGAKIKVGARISGTVVKENVKVGDFVKKGELIAVIDNRELKEELEKAKARLEEVKKTYPKKIAVQETEVKSAEASLKAALSRLEAEKENFNYLKWKLEREKELFKEGFSTKERIKELTSKLAQAESSLKTAEENVKKARLTLKAARKKLESLKVEYSTQLKIARANLKEAQTRYSYSFIYAPKSGVISFVSTQEGETVVAGLNAPQFVTILDPDKLENWIYVDETEIGKVKKGMKVEFTVDTYRDKVFKGVVEEIYPEPKIFNNVVYYIVVARGFKGEGILRPEMTTHNRIIAGIKRGALVVPNRAVKWKKGKFIVYKVVNGKVKEVPVKVGWSDDRFAEILSGLKEGDKVATSITVK